MDRIVIQGGARLRGRVRIGGAKNACLALMPAALLTDEAVVIENVPELSDVTAMSALLRELGAEVEEDAQAGRLVVRAAALRSRRAPYDIVRKMRASFLVLGPLLAREGEAEVSMPGGCAIGERGVDLHLEAMKALGAELDLVGGYVCARAPNGLRGGRIDLSSPTVGGTENALTAAAMACGETLITGAAREPEIVALANLLREMGAEVEGAGSGEIRVQGAKRLRGASQRVIPDRVEFGTYLAAAAITGGDMLIEMEDPSLARAVTERFQESGLRIDPVQGGVRAYREAGPIRPVSFRTGPYPAFPTDMQAQMMAILTLADGESEIEETVFEHRYMHVPELARMGAKIRIQGRRAVVRGVKMLKGAPVMATDIRASASLVIAGLAASGSTTISRVYHIDRGYEHPVRKLAACGARICRVSA